MEQPEGTAVPALCPAGSRPCRLPQPHSSRPQSAPLQKPAIREGLPAARRTFEEALQSLRLVHHLHSCAMHRANGRARRGTDSPRGRSARGPEPLPAPSAAARCPSASADGCPAPPPARPAPHGAPCRPRRTVQRGGPAPCGGPRLRGGPDGVGSGRVGGVLRVGGVFSLSPPSRPLVTGQRLNEVTVIRAQFTKRRAHASPRLWGHSVRGR